MGQGGNMLQEEGMLSIQMKEGVVDVQVNIEHVAVPRRDHLPVLGRVHVATAATYHPRSTSNSTPPVADESEKY